MRGLMRVVVTGSSGRIGVWVVRELRGRGYEVVGVDAKEPAEREEGFRRVELRDVEAVIGVVRGAGAVVHLASVPSIGPEASGERSGAFSNNVTVGFNVMEAARVCGVGRVVNASSIQAYGVVSNHYAGPGSVTAPDYFPIDEGHPLRPRDAYPLSKAVSEYTAMALAEACPSASVWSLRLPWVGVRGERKGELSRGELVKWLGGGLGAIVHPGECARAVRLCIETERRGHTAVNVAEGGRGTLPWTREVLRTLYGKDVPFRRAVEDGGALFDGGLAREVIGFEADGG